MKKILYRGHKLTTEPPPLGEWECWDNTHGREYGSRFKGHVCYMHFADLEVHQYITPGGHQTCIVRCNIGEERTIEVSHIDGKRIRSVKRAKRIAKELYAEEVSGRDTHLNASPPNWEIR